MARLGGGAFLIATAALAAAMFAAHGTGETDTDQDCLRSVVNASDCLPYLRGGSNLTTPGRGCCPEMAGLLESRPACICHLLSNSSNASDSGGGNFVLDVNRALQLPSACNLSTSFNVSLCSATGYPIGSSSSNGTATSPDGGTTVEGNKNGASHIAASWLAVVFLSNLPVTTFISSCTLF